MGAVLDVFHQREKSLPLERKPECRERRSLDAEWKRVAIVVVAMKSEQCSAVGERGVKHLGPRDQLFAMHESDQRSFPLKRLECFRNVLRNCYMVSCTNERLSYALEKRGV